MNRKNEIAHFVLFVLFSGSLAGCGGSPVAPAAAASAAASPEQGHQDDYSKTHGSRSGSVRTCAEAVQKVKTLCLKVQAGFSTLNLGQADGPVHEIGHVLSHLQELAAKQNLSEEQRKTVDESIRSLFEAFGSLDRTIHSGKGKFYIDLADEIEGALAALQDVFPEISQTETEQ